MMTSSMLNVTAQRIANFFTINGASLKEDMLHVSMQKKLVKPKDNITDFFRSSRIEYDSKKYNTIRNDLSEANLLLDIGEKAGTYVFTDINLLKDLATSYNKADVSTEEKQALMSQFTEVRTRIQSTINTTTFDGTKVIEDTSTSSPLRSINIDTRDPTVTFSLSYDSADIADVSGLDITQDADTLYADIDLELEKAGSYLAKTSAYKKGISSQMNILDKKMTTDATTYETLSGTSDARDITTMLKKNLQQQAAIAMLSQAHLSQQSVLLLLR